MPRSKSQEKMVLISVHLPRQLLEELDGLVRKGVFPSRSEAIRFLLREGVLRLSQGIEEEEDAEMMIGR
mgnify:FL=1